MGRKAPLGKGKVTKSGKPAMAGVNATSQGGIPPSGRVMRGGSKGKPVGGPPIVRSNPGTKL